MSVSLNTAYAYLISVVQLNYAPLCANCVTAYKISSTTYTIVFKPVNLAKNATSLSPYNSCSPSSFGHNCTFSQLLSPRQSTVTPIGKTVNGSNIERFGDKELERTLS